MVRVSRRASPASLRERKQRREVEAGRAGASASFVARAEPVRRAAQASAAVPGLGRPARPRSPYFGVHVPAGCGERIQAPRRTDAAGNPECDLVLPSPSILGYRWNRVRHEVDDEPRVHVQGSGRDPQIDTEAHSVKVVNR